MTIVELTLVDLQQKKHEGLHYTECDMLDRVRLDFLECDANTTYIPLKSKNKYAKYIY